METCDVSFFFFYILYHIIVGNLVTRARWGRFTVIHSVSSLAEIINNRQKARRSAGLHILMLVCIGSVFREGLALCWLCPDIHSHTISGSEKKKKGCITQPSSTWIKEGCATPLWAYLRDYQHENTTSRSSVGGRSVIVSCQTSKVPLTASYLTFSSNEFIFHSFWYFGSGSTRDQI